MVDVAKRDGCQKGSVLVGNKCISKDKFKIKERDLIEYEKTAGIGACLPVAVVFREKGYGQIEFGQYGKKEDYLRSFPHYWIRTKDNKILDSTNPDINKKLLYWDIERIPAKVKSGDIDPMLYRKDDFDFWRKKLVDK